MSTHLDAKLIPRLSGATTTFVFKFLIKSLMVRACGILTFRELESLTGFLLSEFLTLNHAWVPCQ